MFCDNVPYSSTIDFFIHRLSDEVLWQTFTIMFWVKFAGVNLGHSQVCACVEDCLNLAFTLPCLRQQAVMGHGLEQKQANRGFQVIEQGGSLFLDFGGWSIGVFIGDFALVVFRT